MMNRRTFAARALALVAAGTVRALGLTIPESLLVFATEVIE
jgi:hypothetical protein